MSCNNKKVVRLWIWRKSENCEGALPRPLTAVLHRTGTPRTHNESIPALTEDRGCLGSPHRGSSAVAAVSARVDAVAGGEATGP